MRNNRIAAWRHVMMMVGLTLTGCEVADELPMEDLEVRAAPAGGPTLQDAYWAVVTLDDPNKVCPDLSAQHWVLEGSRMFTDATPGLVAQEIDPPDLPDTLRGFCLYAWAGPVGAPVLPAHGSIQHASLDWAVVEQMDNGLQSAYRPALRDVFLQQAGRVWAHAPQPEHPVTVGVVDSESEYSEAQPYIEHASSMASVITELACPSKEATCRVDVHRALALPLLENGSVRHDGGYYGARAHVAMGIVESVMAWRKNMEISGQVSRLVVNLSLGWVTEGGLGCGQGEDEPWCETGSSHAVEFEDWVNTPYPQAYAGQAANEAVHAALLLATCQGALVVAAAGNSQDESCNEQPMAPAVWSRYGSPSAAECAQLGIEPPAQVIEWDLYDADRPLVQPASAVDHYGEPIFVTRPGSETRLATPGHMVTVGDSMAPLSGTSLSAAVVSAGAALSWGYDPDPSPGVVVDRLYETATPLGRTSQLDEFGWGSGIDVRRISLCHAVDPTCEGEGEGEGEGDCESYCDPEDMADMSLTDLHNEVDNELAQITVTPFTASGLVTDACWSCGEPVTAMLPNTVDAESYHFFSSCGTSPAAYVPVQGPSLAGPQPEDPPCPDCPILATEEPDSAKAILSIDDFYWGVGITGITLTLRRHGHPSTVLDLTNTPGLITSLQMGQTVRVVLPGVWHSAQQPLRQASFGLQFVNNGIQDFRSNEMLVVRPD